MSNKPHLIPRIVELRATGSTYREIRDATGASLNQIMYWCSPTARAQRLAEATRRAARKRGVESGAAPRPRVRSASALMNELDDYREKVTASKRVLSAIARARQSGKEFSLTDEDVQGLLSQTRCARTGIAFDKDGDFAPSVDRINSAVGYVAGNVQIVCWMYNRAKGANSDAALLYLARALVAANPEIDWD